MEESVKHLVRFWRRWLAMLLMEGALSVLAGSVLGWELARLFGSPVLIYAIGGGLLGLAIWAAIRKPRRVQLIQVADYLNRHNPTLQDSTELLLQPADELSLLQRLQVQRILPAIPQAVRGTRVPQGFLRWLAIWAPLLLLPGLWLLFQPQTSLRRELGMAPIAELAEEAVPLPAGLAQWEVRLSAPSYMQLPVKRQSAFPIEAWEGTQASFEAQFTEPVVWAVLLWGQNDTVSLKTNGEAYRQTLTLRQNTFYALAWQDSTGEWQRSDYAPVTVRPDAPPQVAVVGREPYVKVDYIPGMVVEVPLEYTDDFDLTTSALVATVARGSGESVRFRESRRPIPHDWAPMRATEKLTLRIVPDSLEMTPGDELYFYVETYDNRQPQAQRGRTEMYFLALRDTADNVVQMEGGLGIDLMPDYFRSQRQLIIDTEKLIADRRAGRVTEQEFKQLSNELGYDQKALRLKYGALLGLEDEESGSGGMPVAPEATVEAFFQHEENEEFRDDSHEHGADHDHEESGSIFSRLVDEGYNDTGHDHEGEQPGAEEDPLAAFMHAHDDTEEATFYAQSMKTKLRFALDQMWDAELYLRIYTPAESLPYQREALKMINEIRLDSRIYVERVGFEPPPLKVAEERLKGKQEDIRSVAEGVKLAEPAAYPALRAALPLLERLRSGAQSLTPAEQTLLAQAGNTLAGLALERPGDLLVALSQLKNLEEGSLQGGQQVAAAALVEAAILRLLPEPQPQTTGRSQTLTPLQEQWLLTQKGGQP